MATVAACADAQPSDMAVVDGLVALVAGSEETSLVGWDDRGGDGIPITLPKGDATWVAAGRADVLATLLDGRHDRDERSGHARASP